MAIRPIVLYPDPVLSRPTDPVTQFDDALRDLVSDMFETMIEARGIGLAANQVGVSRRVCLVDLSCGEMPQDLHVLINPRVTEARGRQTGEEGCLSFPDVMLEIERPAFAVVEAVDFDGKPIRVEGEGLLARALVHECEHLDGRVFLQNVSALRRELVRKQIRKRIEAGDWVAAAQ